MDFVRERKHIHPTKLLFADVDAAFVFEFIAFLKGKNYEDGSPIKGITPQKASSINVRLAALKAYTSFAGSIDPCAADCHLELSKINFLLTEEPEFVVLTQKQINLIIDQTPNTRKGWKDKTFLRLLFESCCRVSELCNLTIDRVCLDQDQGQIIVHGKGKKHRVVPLTANMVNMLKNYMQIFHRGDSYQLESNYLFYTVRSGHATKVTDRNMRRILQDYATKARELDPSIPEHVYPHMIRRSGATNLYHTGVSMEQVGAFLGHSRLDTTKRYVRQDKASLKDKLSLALNQSKDEEPLWQDDQDFCDKLFGLRYPKDPQDPE